jgi:tRNA modification GTPase
VAHAEEVRAEAGRHARGFALSRIAAVPDTIAAIATAPGAAGIGIVRLSGARAARIARRLCGLRRLPPRRARHVRFLDGDGSAIDDGIVLYFRAPRSYTGEDVVELQAHGSPPLLARLLARCLALGARAARPGEFTERAFLEGKLDLAQAEAVAALIAAGSAAPPPAARRSLEGEFSARVHGLVEALTVLRVHVEAGFDFPDEDIDALAAPAVQARLVGVLAQLRELRAAAARGVRLADGLHAVIAGAPNVGKSSLLNALAADERAIVSAVAGTTRDLLRERLRIDGVELTLVDTAGLRDSPDAIEAEGMRRARAELARADLVLLVLDAREPDAPAPALPPLAPGATVLRLYNKADALDAHSLQRERDDPARRAEHAGDALWVSARTGLGLDTLRAGLRALAGDAGGNEAGGGFSARARHLESLDRAEAGLLRAQALLEQAQAELAAEELRRAQAELGAITAPVDADALLGRIFAGFCIGK